MIPCHDSPEWTTRSFFGDEPLEYCHTYIHRLQGVLGMHRCAFYELNIVVEGSAAHYVKQTRFDAPLGSIFFVPPGIPHGYASEGGAGIFHALIHPDFFMRYEAELRSLSGYTLLFEVDPYLRNESQIALPIQLTEETYGIISPMLQALIHHERKQGGDREMLKNIGLLYLICQLSSLASSLRILDKPRDNPYALQIARSMEYIRMNVNRRLTVAALARQACMARSTYERHFARIVGCSPIKFLMRCRMANARRLLCYTAMPITGVALECGFYDASHFIHAFSQLEGCTPSDYRAINYRKAPYSVCSICG